MFNCEIRQFFPGKRGDFWAKIHYTKERHFFHAGRLSGVEDEGGLTGMTQSLQADPESARDHFADACFPVLLVDGELTILFANKEASEQFPAFRLPDGLRTLLSRRRPPDVSAGSGSGNILNRTYLRCPGSPCRRRLFPLRTAARA